jgi:autotransporter-associated beta strand protein
MDTKIVRTPSSSEKKPGTEKGHIMKNHQLAIAIAILFALVSGSITHAANVTWATGDSTWDTSTASWSGDSTTYSDPNVDNVTFEDTQATVPATVTVQGGGVSPLSTTVNTSSTYTFTGGAIGGSGGISKSGTGVLDLRGMTNTFTGGLALGAGTVIVDGPGNLGNTSGDVTFTGNATLNFTTNNKNYSTRAFNVNTGVDATLDLTGIDNGQVAYVYGVVSGPGSVTLVRTAGAGAANVRLLNSANDFVGLTVTNRSGVQFNSAGALGSSSAAIDLQDGFLQPIAAGLTIPHDINISSGSGRMTGSSATWSGQISGATLFIFGGNQTLTNTSNNYGQTRFQQSGSLTISGPENLGTSNIFVEYNKGHRLTITGGNPNTFTTPIAISGGVGGIIIDVNNANATVDWDGAISGGGASDHEIEKAGPGTLNLNSTSFTFNDPVIVTQGTLNFNDGATTGLGTFSVASGARLGGTGSITLGAGNTVNVQDGGGLAPGTSTGTLTVSGGAIDIDGAFTYEWEIDQTSEDLISAFDIDLSGMTGGTIAISETINGYERPIAESEQFALFTYSGTLTGFNPALWDVVLASGERFLVDSAQVLNDGVGTIYLSGIASVPEPTSALLLLVGTVLAVRRRRA